MRHLVSIERYIRTKDDIYEAMKCTEMLLTMKEFSQTSILKLQLVTEEACTNAYEYCLKSGLWPIQVEWRITPNAFELIVRQKGKRIPLTNKKNIINSGPRGRGITLILNLMDEVEVREGEGFVELYMKALF